jgi:hypothetical protein
MFEDFSFSSPSSRPTRLALDPEERLMVDNDSLISPLSSRCPSPQSRFRRRRTQPPTSVPYPYEAHAQTKNHNRLSISTLTQKLHEHTLSPHASHPNPIAPPRTGYVLTPPDTDHDDDLSLSSASASSPTFPDADADFGLAPPPDIRSQRQHISRMQCNESSVEAMRSLLEEDEDECHPSSLPVRASPRRRLARSRFGPEERRRKSSAGVLASRVEKGSGHHGGHGHHANAYGKRDGVGLRRKSLVSAALASMVERDD